MEAERIEGAWEEDKETERNGEVIKEYINEEVNVRDFIYIYIYI